MATTYCALGVRKTPPFRANQVDTTCHWMHTFAIMLFMRDIQMTVNPSQLTLTYDIDLEASARVKTVWSCLA